MSQDKCEGHNTPPPLSFSFVKYPCPLRANSLFARGGGGGEKNFYLGKAPPPPTNSLIVYPNLISEYAPGPAVLLNEIIVKTSWSIDFSLVFLLKFGEQIPQSINKTWKLYILCSSYLTLNNK